MEPSADMRWSIAEFPEPQDITGVRSWFGLTNPVDCFHDDWLIELHRHGFPHDAGTLQMQLKGSQLL